MHIHHFHALEKEMGMKGNSLEGFSTSEHFHDHIQLKRIDSDRDFSADILLTSEKKKTCSIAFSLSYFPVLFNMLPSHCFVLLCDA